VTINAVFVFMKTSFRASTGSVTSLSFFSKDIIIYSMYSI
jgi:hypothetical protein